MLVPESSVVSSVSSDPLKGHVISMYLATAGAGGSLLGADEKEIIYLVFGIIDLQNNEVSDQYFCLRNNEQNPKNKFLKNMFWQ